VQGVSAFERAMPVANVVRFVCTMTKETTGTIRLRSYSLPDELNIPATICDAALATSAATGFFDPCPSGHADSWTVQITR
jgi:hypothetical protein